MLARGGLESVKARQAWADFVAMGPERSIRTLHAQYTERGQSGGEAGAPTRRRSTLDTWAARFGWQVRLQVIADGEAAVATAAQATYIRGILEANFGLAHERVKALNELADVLLDELRDPSKRWVTEPKWIGSVENGRMVELERFNHQEFEQFRGLLDDIAKEVGGRVRKAEVTGHASGPIEIRHTVDDTSALLLADLLAVGLARRSGDSGAGG